ncbi:TetR/AcrR family transcriptional regulator [Fictibacillus phosphorivorans]|uniref:TetR/AcrR family transcriptional regulator n=1 Tax=Fictibacillus phosphorivorans TaxID=1221500 RepID=UPI00203C6205|nr:TetR/AcrR family transcriptional regulator [Fictibacillus phosphorivorans]MCM3718431.1 TetR/AcrR family transcriptional regulator [Fictibacillus phosphorivorans]MCM3776055.1 TetR/AcrR family transcriptional regulator [Fictibacillus phosphorivorans]
MSKKEVPSLVKDEKLIQKRREEMVKAAVSLFKKNGFHRTTTREIAKVSGFSIGTLYEYIRSKEDILYLVCDSIYDGVKWRLQQDIDSADSGIKGVEKAITAYFKVMDDMQDEVLVMYQEAKSLSDEALPYVLKKELEMTAIFERLLSQAVHKGDLDLNEKEIQAAAHNILIIGQMWTFRRWALQKIYTLEEYTKLQLQQLLHGIKGA